MEASVLTLAAVDAIVKTKAVAAVIFMPLFVFTVELFIVAILTLVVKPKGDFFFCRLLCQCEFIDIADIKIPSVLSRQA